MDALRIPYVESPESRRRKEQMALARERSRRYYEAHRDALHQKNAEKYAKKKEEGWTPEEVARRRRDNRLSYYRRKEASIKAGLEALKEGADPARVAIVDELIADNNFSQWGKEVLDVVAFIVRGKTSQ